MLVNEAQTSLCKPLTNGFLDSLSVCISVAILIWLSAEFNVCPEILRIMLTRLMLQHDTGTFSDNNIKSKIMGFTFDTKYTICKYFTEGMP